MIDKKLQEFRNKIDDCDQRILQIIEERYDVVRQVGEYKGLSDKRESIMRPSREYSMVEELVSKVKNTPNDIIRAIHRAIIAGAVSIEEEISICAYDKDSFYLAREYFGAWNKVSISNNSDDILCCMQESQYSIAVLPLDDSLKIWQNYESNNMPYIFARLPFINDVCEKTYVAIGFVRQEDGDNVVYIYMENGKIITSKNKRDGGIYLGSYFI